ncbi:MAG: PilZ domain-containing protein [Pseudomonadota bacterium]
MRKHPRRTVELPVLVSDAANRVKAGIRFGAAEISAGGAFLRSDLLFEVGEILNLQIEIPPNRRIAAVGRVVRVSRGTAQDRLAGMGIEFVDLSPADRVAIETAIR